MQMADEVYIERDQDLALTKDFANSSPSSQFQMHILEMARLPAHKDERLLPFLQSRLHKHLQCPSKTAAASQI